MGRRKVAKKLIVVGPAVASAAAFVCLSEQWASTQPRAQRSHQARGRTLQAIAIINLPGPPGRRFDYLTIDYDDRYLLSAHLAAGRLYVIDLKSHTVVRTIPDVPGIEGVTYVPDLKKVYTSNW